MIWDDLQSAKSKILYFLPLPVAGSFRKTYGLSNVHLTSLSLLEKDLNIIGYDFIDGSL